jgi:hypothetical protein
MSQKVVDPKIGDAICGRFDGVETLSLGSSRLALVLCTPNALTPHAAMLHLRDMVRDMLHTSAGHYPPELVLEGDDHEIERERQCRDGEATGCRPFRSQSG